VHRRLEEHASAAQPAGEQRRLSEFIVTDASDVTFKGKPLPLDLIPSSPRLRKRERELIFELTAKGYAMEALQNQVGKRLRDDRCVEADRLAKTTRAVIKSRSVAGPCASVCVHVRASLVGCSGESAGV
jgi:hypothetical protein